MLFNSFEYIFGFLPVVVVIYFLLNKLNITAAKCWLLLCSLFFYSWWNISYLPLILASIIVNYTVSTALKRMPVGYGKGLLALGVTFNLILLGYFKYTDFFISNVNALFAVNVPMLNLLLPLAISFFTFQQIAYLVDVYRGETKDYSLLNYFLFVSFFPQLIAGPIVQHKEVIPQFEDPKNKVMNYDNITRGLFIFAMGLFKKVVIADSFATWANFGFDEANVLTFLDGWVTSLSYTFQLYYDFSGYTDMAIGAALLLNIRLPINFNSPYQAVNIQDFWRRWHITLSRFLSNYLYIPLGGNRKGRNRTMINIMIVFLLGGFWHGAGWTFVFWGFLHGLALVIYRGWTTLNIKGNPLWGKIITFNFVNIAWIFFRAQHWQDAVKVLKGMFGINGIVLPDFLASRLSFLSSLGVHFSQPAMREIGLYRGMLMIAVFVLLVFFTKNSIELTKQFKPTWQSSVHFSLMVFIALITMYASVHTAEFLYFNF